MRTNWLIRIDNKTPREKLNLLLTRCVMMRNYQCKGCIFAKGIDGTKKRSSITMAHMKFPPVSKLFRLWFRKVVKGGMDEKEFGEQYEKRIDRVIGAMTDVYYEWKIREKKKKSNKLEK